MLVEKRIYMKKLTWALVTTLAFVFAIPSSCQTLVVGTCKKTSAPSYSTIHEAVNAAAANPGTTVLVCPGAYAEQVVITTPLTLKGLSIPPSTTRLSFRPAEA
jgi:pectin methylesterase-like acyl-CoA thioesterase